ncbi:MULTISPECIES: DUF885 family protein [unclassified Streptomyces]|uniref:DUF885 family protein n=1 Tax=unclassified Streptomyces TaxID=2593676 RepID=UPI002DDC1E74|nr:DUF885 family protein [Streptomyces sp. NBC_01237]WRZ76356.1 DUF885 domain-containing protein [Streptomyces sp. NBC_01237]
MSGGSTELGGLAEEFWAWRTATQPDSHDDVTRIERPAGLLADWSPDAIAERRRALAGFTQRHGDLKVGGEPVATRVDATLLGSALARVHWELDLLRDWRRNPCFYLDQALVPLYNLLLQPPPWPGTRGREIVALLGHVPDVLEQARRNLTGHAAGPFARYALRLLDTADKALGTAMTALGPFLPTARTEELAAATGGAQRALVGFREWLREHLPGFGAPISVGPEAFRYFLHHVALLPYSMRQLLDMGRQEYARTAAAEVMLRRRHRDLPEPPPFADTARQVERQRTDEQDVRALLRREGIIDLPDDLRHYRNTPMPAYLEPLTWLGVPHYIASARRPGDDALRYLRPPRADLPYFQRVEAYDPRVGIVHEGVHAWQAALSWRHPDPLRRHYYDSAANEGIAFHAEELALQAGLFDGTPTSALFLVNAMRLRALRVEVDIALAVGELTLEQAAARLAEQVPLDPGTAWEEAAFFAGHPGQGLSYLTGKIQIHGLLADAARRRGEGFRLDAFLGRLWRDGNVPFALQRWELLDDRSHLDAAQRRGGDRGASAVGLAEAAEG